MTLRAMLWSTVAVLIFPSTLFSAPTTLGSLPATYAGLLPCADCAGIRYQINVLPNGAFMQRMTYLRDGQDVSFYEVGHWTLTGDGRTLTLDGGKEAMTFWTVKSSRTLRKLDRERNPIDSKLPYELSRAPAVVSMEPRVRFVGMFRYMADAARFQDCLSGLSWPVAMSADYPALEREYAKKRSSAGAELLVSLEGRVEPLPRMEGKGTEPALVVEKFERATPGEKCEERDVQAGLSENRWRPVRFGDQVVQVSSGQREPWVVLDSHSKRVTGSGGCNRFSSTYEAGGGTLRFGSIVSTKMACPGIDTETAFFRVLEKTRRYRVYGRNLELMDDNRKILARLEERNLR